MTEPSGFTGGLQADTLIGHDRRQTAGLGEIQRLPVLFEAYNDCLQVMRVSSQTSLQFAAAGPDTVGQVLRSQFRKQHIKQLQRYEAILASGRRGRFIAVADRVTERRQAAGFTEGRPDQTGHGRRKGQRGPVRDHGRSHVIHGLAIEKYRGNAIRQIFRGHLELVAEETLDIAADPSFNPDPLLEQGEKNRQMIGLEDKNK